MLSVIKEIKAKNTPYSDEDLLNDLQSSSLTHIEGSHECDLSEGTLIMICEEATRAIVLAQNTRDYDSY